MAKLNPSEFFEHMEKGVLKPVYLLAGEEGFLIDRALARLTELALSGAPRDFNLDVYYAKDSRADEVVIQADTLPMMAERRVVVLKEADRLKDLAPLKAYMEGPSDLTVLILTAEGAEKGKEAALAKAAQAKGVYVHFYHPFESELARWTKLLAREAGYAIDSEAAAYMKEVLGDNLALIEAELKKVYNYVGDRKGITLTDVKESVGDFGLPLIFDLVDAVADKKAGRALELLSKLLREGEQPLMILGMMAQHWRKLVDAKARAGNGEGPDELTKAFRLNFKNKKEFLGQVARMTEAELAGAFHLFRKADAALKGSALTPRMVMERLVFELSGAGGF